MSNTEMAKIDRQFAITVLPLAGVVIALAFAWQMAVPSTSQVTVCEKLTTENGAYSLKLLDGDTQEVPHAVFDTLDPLRSYNVEKRWFKDPVFKSTADFQEGFLCWNAP
ncbi:MAG: hypothetical protein JWM00_376 [Candidatus Saccharibacteria bacterium]|nr:hypothetical protein [Candidatus Saccharibacteria bacterium]